LIAISAVDRFGVFKMFPCRQMALVGFCQNVKGLTWFYRALGYCKNFLANLLAVFWQFYGVLVKLISHYIQSFKNLKKMLFLQKV